MKMIVETTGGFGLLDSYTGDYLRPDRPSVASSNQFVASRVSLGQLKILASDLRDDATDAEFVKYLKDSKPKGKDKSPEKAVALAVASFESAFTAVEAE